MGGGARAPGLDGVRALAVIAVIAFHEQLSAFSGGFLGVDVFFVLSGYLITDLLVARWDRHGRLDLGDFWARRARRLLPALAVLLVAVTAATAVSSRGQLAALRSALLAAVTYSSNWWQALAHHSYFAQFGPPSPLQHLWSLAIEEQFYLVWPLLLIVILQDLPVRAPPGWPRVARRGPVRPGHGLRLCARRGPVPGLLRHRHARIRAVHRGGAGAELAIAAAAGAQPRQQPGSPTRAAWPGSPCSPGR